MTKLLLAFLLFASPAIAATYIVSVPGVLTNQFGQGTDANLAVGSDFMLTAQFDSSLLVPWQNTGYLAAGLYGLPTTGDSFFRIDAPGMTWQASDSQQDGARYIGNRGLPGIFFTPDMTQVVGIMGWLSPSGSSARPEIDLGNVNTPWFNIRNAIAWNDHYNTPGFSGTWDFANASIVDPPSAVPEPKTWALFLVGFGAIGFAMRGTKYKCQG